MSREELLLYRGENDTDNEPKFCEINVNCQSNPDSNLDMTVKHKEEELFKIIKEKMKQCVCQMFFDFKKGDDNICLTTASAFYIKEQYEVSCIVKITYTILLCSK